MNKTTVWKGVKDSKVLIIGHDPRLIGSKTEAEFCFFADYYFKKKPTRKSELKKYELAENTFKYISFLTSNKYSHQEFVITNLCNHFLPSTNGMGTVLIPEKFAADGLEEIRTILKTSPIELIFAMSTQVNYWLQKLNFYPADNSFIEKTAPANRGIISNPQYYAAKQSSIFQEICGKKFIADDKYPLYPILHVKNWPLKGSYKRYYEQLYLRMIDEIKNFD